MSDETGGDGSNIQAPSPSRNCTKSVAAQNAGNSQPPPLLLKAQPFFPCTITIVPTINGMRSKATYLGAMPRIRHPPPISSTVHQADALPTVGADHVPEPHFITRLIGYFRHDRMAFVQTPHAFYNFDSFQARLDHKNRDRRADFETGEPGSLEPRRAAGPLLGGS